MLTYVSVKLPACKLEALSESESSDFKSISTITTKRAVFLHVLSKILTDYSSVFKFVLLIIGQSTSFHFQPCFPCCSTPGFTIHLKGRQIKMRHFDEVSKERQLLRNEDDASAIKKYLLISKLIHNI